MGSEPAEATIEIGHGVRNTAARANLPAHGQHFGEIEIPGAAGHCVLNTGARRERAEFGAISRCRKRAEHCTLLLGQKLTTMECSRKH
jgi:hypothetical protein